MELTPGSPEWLEVTRTEIGGDQRLVQDLLLAKTFLERIVGEWDRTDPVMAAALHKAAVISYARPFKESVGSSGKKYRYPVRRISTASGFDREVHEHLLEIRDGMVAHSDGTLAEKTINLAFIDITSDDVRGRIAFQASAQSAAIFGFNDVGLAKAQLDHVAASLLAGQTLLARGLKSYLAAAQTNPKVIADLDSASDTRRIHIATLKDIPGGDTVQTAMPPSASMLKAPQFKVGTDQYRYFVLEFAERATGKVALVDEHGKEHEYILGWSTEEEPKAPD